MPRLSSRSGAFFHADFAHYGPPMKMSLSRAIGADDTRLIFELDARHSATGDTRRLPSVGPICRTRSLALAGGKLIADSLIADDGARFLADSSSLSIYLPSRCSRLYLSLFAAADSRSLLSSARVSSIVDYAVACHAEETRRGLSFAEDADAPSAGGGTPLAYRVAAEAPA